MKKSIISLLFFFAVCTFSPNIVFAQVDSSIRMYIDTQSLDFGNVCVGRTKSLMITIGNSFSGSWNPLIISLNTNQPFSISPIGIFKLNMSPFGKIFTITFKPTAFISYNQTITLLNNATIIDNSSTGVESVMNGNNSQYISIHIIGVGVKETIIQPSTPGPAKMMQYGTGKY